MSSSRKLKRATAIGRKLALAAAICTASSVWLIVTGAQTSVKSQSSTIFYVDKTAGSDTTGNGSSGNPWASIGKCAGATGAASANPGGANTCEVRPGSDGIYNERVTPTSGADASDRLTIRKAFGTAVYVVQGFNFTSKAHVVIGGSPGFGFDSIGTDNNATGLTASALMLFGSSTDISVSYNTIGGTATLAGGTVACLSGTGTDIYIIGNSIHWCGLMGDGSATWPDTAHHRGAMAISGTYTRLLIDGNDFQHTGDFLSSIGGSYIMVRGNTAHNVDMVADFGNNAGPTTVGNNGHQDFWQSGNSNYTTLERNTARDVNPNVSGSAFHFSLLQCATVSNGGVPCTDVIERYNVFANNSPTPVTSGTGSAFVGTDATQGQPTLYLHQYNNTVASNGNAAGDNCFSFFAETFTSIHGASKNQICYNSIKLQSKPGGISIDTNSAADFVSWRDLFYSSVSTFVQSGICDFHPANCYITGHEALLQVDPLFVDPLSNWNLQAGSPALGTGDYLASVTSTTGSGTSIVVDDCHYFQWGYGLTGVFGDTVGFGATSAAAKTNSSQVTAIDYSTCTMTLASSISWTSGDHAYVVKDSYGNFTPGFEGSGTAPNIGALVALTATTYPLSVASAHGTVTSSPAGISCGATCSASFTGGTSVTLTQSSTAADYLFTGWSGGGCSGTGTCTVTMTSNMSVTAVYVPVFTLTVTSANGTVSSLPAGINCGSTCSASFAPGTFLTLTAAPNSGYGVTPWTGCDFSLGAVCFVTLNADTSVTANYAPIPTCTLSPSMTAVQLGGSITLSWTSTNATSVSILGIGNVSPSASGNTSVIAGIVGSQVFTMTATGAGGTGICSSSLFPVRVDKKVANVPF